MQNEQIGQRIKELRCRKGLSQEELARQVDLTRTAITKIESGSQDVRFKELEKFAEALGISLGNLVEESRPVRQGSDREFFRSMDNVVLWSCEAPLTAGYAGDRKLRNLLLLLLGRLAGDPSTDSRLLAAAVGHADRIRHEASGNTASGLPYPFDRYQEAVDEALHGLTADGRLELVMSPGRPPRHLPMEKPDLDAITAAEYLAVEQAICISRT